MPFSSCLMTENLVLGRVPITVRRDNNACAAVHQALEAGGDSGRQSSSCLLWRVQSAEKMIKLTLAHVQAGRGEGVFYSLTQELSTLAFS